MDEINPSHEIDAAIREVAALRDKALSKVPALSSARRATLAASLVRQFPIEAALIEVAASRDRAIRPSSAKIPAPVASILNRQLADGERKSATGPVTFWLSRFRLPLAAALMLCALLAAALPRFGGWEAASRRNARNFGPLPPLDQIRSHSRIAFDAFAGSRAVPFTRELALSSFNLNTNEPASLQLSFLANSIRFADGNDTPLALRLDLPARVALTEDGLSRTP
jgi:hypothetical protein